MSQRSHWRASAYVGGPNLLTWEDIYHVESEEFVPNASFVEDLNADSRDLVELIMSIEKAFSIKIPDEDVEKLTTAGETQQYLRKKGVL